MNKFLGIICIAFIALLSCQRSASLHAINNDALTISINTACGWCAPGDSMTITKASTIYKYFPSSCSKEGKPVTSVTTQNDWNELIQLLNAEKFSATKLNECNICVDGCDEWITVQQGNYTHTIRYGSKENEKLKELRPFIDKLQAIRASMKMQVVK